MVRAVLAGLLTLVATGSPARAASFADPGARVFTLAPNGTVSAIATLPNGDIVFALRGTRVSGHRVPGKLMRLTSTGALHEVRADGAYRLVPESSQTVLRVPAPG